MHMCDYLCYVNQLLIFLYSHILYNIGGRPRRTTRGYTFVRSDNSRAYIKKYRTLSYKQQDDSSKANRNTRMPTRVMLKTTLYFVSVTNLCYKNNGSTLHSREHRPQARDWPTAFHTVSTYAADSFVNEQREINTITGKISWDHYKVKSCFSFVQ